MTRRIPYRGMEPNLAPAKMEPLEIPEAINLEKRGRWWLVLSFLACPCHLPITLAVLGTVLAGTSFGVVVRDHAWLAGAVVTAVWALGTGYGLRLVSRAEKANGACPVPTPSLR